MVCPVCRGVTVCPTEEYSSIFKCVCGFEGNAEDFGFDVVKEESDSIGDLYECDY